MSSSPRIAVVTGAGSGIGLALTQALLDRDIPVVAIDRDIDAVPSRAIAHAIDVRDADAMQRLARSFDSRAVSHVFANAGVGAPGGVLQSSESTWQWAWDVNVAGALRTLRLWWPQLVAGKGKAVATVSSAALQTYPGAGPYRATKAALLSALESLYYESRDSGVGVHALCPGIVRSNIMEMRRYEEAGSMAPMGDNPFAAFLSQAMLQAEPAAAFAQRVLDGLDAGAPFYWFTHPETRGWIDARHEAMYSTGQPFSDFGKGPQ